MSTHIATNRILRMTLIVLLAFAAFFASYRFAVARSGAQSPSGGVAAALPAGGAGAAASGSSCACCGGAQPPAGEEPVGAATVEGDVQRISVDLSKGYYDPTQIELKAGIPAEITFGASSGCTAQVQSKDLGFFEDLTTGPKTVRLPALEPGTYAFSCGMEMVFGAIVVK